MKFIFRIIIPLFLFGTLLVGCEKELSFESIEVGNVVGEGTAVGAFSDSSGSCAKVRVLSYAGVGLALNDSNRIQFEMNFTQIGSYFISTDTVSGVYFSKSGLITTTGPQIITLVGHGNPRSEGFLPLKVRFKGNLCSFDLKVYAVATATNADYFPISTNSYWKYLSSNPMAQSEDTFRAVATNITARNTTSGATYNVFAIRETPAFVDSQYYRKSSGLYHQFGIIDFAGVASNEVFAEYVFLKDNVPVASTWETATYSAIVGGSPEGMKLSFQIIEKGENVVLNNLLFRNVIKVRTVQQISSGTTFLPVLTFESWYAKGIGLVNVAVAEPIFGYSINQYKVF